MRTTTTLTILFPLLLAGGCSGSIGPECLPRPETCNSVDDDCDLQVDEDGACDDCSGAEVCNGRDDNCDRRVDEPQIIDGVLDDGCLEGTECVQGRCVPVQRRCDPEVCNGIDDDCNGVTDDVPGGCGECGPGNDCEGDLICVEGGCVDHCTLGDEICNGDDDDCDGDVDEDEVECDENGVCTVDTGCPADFLCEEGRCIPEPACLDEVCNGIDDDCDGGVDEGCGCQADGECRRDEICEGGACVPGCRDDGDCDGDEVCQSGTCVEGCPTEETCNGIDDNCNGIVDEAVLTCGEWDCTLEQASGCAFDEVCVFGWCVELDDCEPVAESCNGQDDDCDRNVDEPNSGCDGDICWIDNAGCSFDQVCQNGRCEDICVAETEICDAKDNDCDGQVDEQVICVYPI